ncbi:MAG TPA: hypothetical protein VF389_08370, partial [Woeseiaceae bacterium]
RRAQEAAAEARRRAREAEERRRDAELHGVFEPLPEERASDETGNDQAERPMSPPAGTPETVYPNDGPTTITTLPEESSGLSTVSDTPAVAPSETTESSDLEAIRRELERRQGDSTDDNSADDSTEQ